MCIKTYITNKWDVFLSPVRIKKYSPIDIYPHIRRDLSFILPADFIYDKFKNSLVKTSSLILDVSLKDIFSKDTDKFLTVTVVYGHKDRTLNEKDEVFPLEKKLVKDLESGFGVKLRGSL